MAFSRYARSPRLGFGAQHGTSAAVSRIRAAIKAGSVPVDEIIVRGAERLDTLAGVVYGDARYWWVLAAASEIGWGLQVPTGTIIKIPQLDAISALIG
jgi:nucleoid-associated protein YgaU